MNILKLLFSNGHKQKILDVKKTVEQPELYKKNQELNKKLLKSQRDIRTIECEARKAKIHLDTVIAIAIANGSFDNK